MTVRQITDKEFNTDVLASNKINIIKIWNNNCPHCVTLSPIIEELSNEISHINFMEINSDENPEIIMNYGVRSAPTLLFFKDGELFHTIVGYDPNVKTKIKKLLNL